MWYAVCIKDGAKDYRLEGEYPQGSLVSLTTDFPDKLGDELEYFELGEDFDPDNAEYLKTWNTTLKAYEDKPLPPPIQTKTEKIDAIIAEISKTITLSLAEEVDLKAALEAKI